MVEVLEIGSKADAPTGALGRLASMKASSHNPVIPVSGSMIDRGTSMLERYIKR